MRASLGGSHGKVHGSASNVRERSRAGAEWVRAPIETHSTPVLGDRPERLKVTPPLASSSRSSADLRHGGAELLLVHVVQQQARGARRSACSISAGSRDLDLERARELGRRLAGALRPPAAMPPAAAMWFSLIRIAS